MTGTGPFEVFDLSLLAADGYLWLSAHSDQGSVYGVPRELPAWTQAGYATPAEWLGSAIRHARADADQEARAVGEQLRRLVFEVPEIAALFQQTRGVATSRGAQVLLRLLAAPASLSSWPWELLVDPQHDDGYLALARDTQVVRAGRARTYPVRLMPVAPPLQVLLVMSSPLRSGPNDEEAPFDLYAEKRALLGELEPLVQRGLLEVVVEDRPTLDRLRSRMVRQRRGFHIVHFIGHAQPAGLKLEAPTGRGRLVSSGEFGLLLQQLPDLRLAVFAGCETARAPTVPGKETWPGQLSTADVCIRDACPMVVGMQAVLPFGTERLFTRYFYQALVAGKTVAEATRLARHAIAGDDNAGGRLLNWAVPCLFTGGSEPGALVDPDARATIPVPIRRVGLRLGVQQGELRFISRLNELRQAVDVLMARVDARVAMVVGQPGSGKSSFIDRVFEELDPDTLYLLVTMDRLLREEDPLLFLCERVFEVVRRSGRRPPPRGRNEPPVWWERLLEVLAETPLALALDDADRLRGDDPRVVPVRKALADLVRRRGRTRLALTASEDIVAVTGMIPANLVRPILLQALSWPEVWQWIRRNLPVLSRFDETVLAGYYVNLPRLEDWESLAEAVAAPGAGVQLEDLPALVRQIGSTLTPMPAGATSAPPVFGAEAPPNSLRVAVAGPYTEGRQEEFARALTQFAALHHTAGRITGGEDTTSRLAELLTVPTPFDASGMTTFEAVRAWVRTACDAGANLLLLDCGSTVNHEAWDALLREATGRDRLVIAAGGITPEPVYPAWSPEALAVGALEADGTRAGYSFYDHASRKPDLFAPKSVAGTTLAPWVADDPALQGPSFASLYVLAAAVLVWATDRSLTASEVRSILVDTADVATGDEPFRRLDTEAALAFTRRRVLLVALGSGPLTLPELLATTGVRPELALPILDHEAKGGSIRRTTSHGAERYELPTRQQDT